MHVGPESVLNVLTNDYIRAHKDKNGKIDAKLSFKWPVRRDKLHKCEPSKPVTVLLTRFATRFISKHILPSTLVAYNYITPPAFVMLVTLQTTANKRQCKLKSEIKHRIESVKSFPINFVSVADKQDQRPCIIQQHVENFPNELICIWKGCTKCIVFVLSSRCLDQLELVQHSFDGVSLAFAWSLNAHARTPAHICVNKLHMENRIYDVENFILANE